MFIPIIKVISVGSIERLNDLALNSNVHIITPFHFAAFTVVLQMMNQSMPRNSDSAPVLLVFYVIIMAESTLSLFTTCLVLVAHYRGKVYIIFALFTVIKSIKKKSINRGMHRGD